MLLTASRLEAEQKDIRETAESATVDVFEALSRENILPLTATTLYYSLLLSTTLHYSLLRIAAYRLLLTRHSPERISRGWRPSGAKAQRLHAQRALAHPPRVEEMFATYS